MPPVPAPASASARSTTEAIDILHRKDVDLRSAHQLFLDVVEVPDADQHRVLGQDRGAVAGESRELVRFGAKDGRERHAVNVARLAGLRRVHVAVRVDPQQSELLIALAQKGCSGGHRSSAQAVIAAERDRQRALVE